MKKVKEKLKAIFNLPLSQRSKNKTQNRGSVVGSLIPIPIRSDNRKLFPYVKAFLLIMMVSGFSVMQSQGQIIKKLQKKVEKKVEQRADRKVDKSIDKALDATEREAEKSLQAAPTDESNMVADRTTPAAATEVPTTANLAEGLVMMAGDCTDFIWFKEGSMMKFEAKDGNGKTTGQSKMLVNKVYNKGGATVADVNFSDDKKNEFTMQFKCAGDKLYMDFSAAVKEMMAKSNPENDAQMKAAAENVEMGFSDGFMSFPKNMYPGQKLDDAVFTMKTSTGSAGMDVTSYLVDRKVEAKEKVTTPAGTFETIKVVGTRKTAMNLLGRERNMGKPTVEYVWISPGIGTIKQEAYTDKGKLQSMSHLIEYEM